jgi:hypothetical protein
MKKKEKGFDFEAIKFIKIPSIEPAARPIDLANTGGSTPSGFWLSVSPNLSKSTEKFRKKTIIIFNTCLLFSK